MADVRLILHLTDAGKRDSTFDDILAEITATTFPSVASLLNPLAASGSGCTDLAQLVGKHGLWMDITSSAARTAVGPPAGAPSGNQWQLTPKSSQTQMMYNICLYVRVRRLFPPQVLLSDHRSGCYHRQRATILPCQRISGLSRSS